MINQIKSKLYKIKRSLGKYFIKFKIFISISNSNGKYDYNIAREYWENVPKAQGSEPWNTEKLKDISDHDLITQFETEQKIARQKNERQLGFSLAFDSIKGIDAPVVMDYGSGIGFYGFEVLEHFPTSKVTFVDITRTNLDIIQRLARIKEYHKRIITIEVKDSKAEDLHFDNKYDLIISMGVLHHTPYAKNIVHGLTNYLKKGGIFEVMLYNKHYKKRLSLKKQKKLTESSFGELTDPIINGLKNPYSEAYDDEKSIKLFGKKYSLISKDYPTYDYNTYRFKKVLN